MELITLLLLLLSLLYTYIYKLHFQNKIKKKKISLLDPSLI